MGEALNLTRGFKPLNAAAHWLAGLTLQAFKGFA